MLRETGSVYGVYRVVRLTGYTEKSAEGDFVGVTYVDPDCVSGPGTASALARIPGGPLPDGTTVPGAVDRRRDEVLGLVLQPISDSRAAYTFGPSEASRRLDAQSYGNLHLRLTGSVDAFAAEAKKLDSVACDAPATPVAALPNLAGFSPSSPTSWTLPKPVFTRTEPRESRCAKPERPWAPGRAGPGRASALEVVKKRAGGQFDPAIAQTFARDAEALIRRDRA